MCGSSCDVIGGSPIEVLSVNSVVGTVPNFGSVTDAAGSSLFRSASSCNNRGLRGRSRFGDDVDDAINRIGSPQRCSRTANHFNPVQIFKHHVLDIPVHTGKQRGIHAPAVDEDQ